MDSPIWKPGILILLIVLLFSGLLDVESVPAFRKKASSLQAQMARSSTRKTNPGRYTFPKFKPFGKINISYHPPSNAAEWEKQQFLAAHNKIRLSHGLPPFQWDPKLVLYAKQYCVERFNDCGMVHSTGPYGENLFWGSGNKWTAADAVKFWDDENKYYNGASNECQSGQVCGHYTQIVWRDSVRLGCVRTACKNGGTYIVCEYDPPGNYSGEDPFDSHTP